MKLITTICKTRCANMKSANPRSALSPWNSCLFSGFTWSLRQTENIKKHCKTVAHGMFNTVLYQLFVSNKTLLVWWDLSTYHPGQMSWPLKWSHSKRSWTGMCRQGSSTQTVSRRSRKCKVSKRQWSSASWMSCWCILDIVSELQTLKKSFCWFYLTILWYIRLYTYTSSVQ